MGIYMPMRPRLKRVASAPGLLFPAQEPPAPEGESLRHFVQGHKCPSSLHNKKPAMSYNLCIPMKQKYDFSHGKRGRIAPPEPEPRGKTRITIRLDEELVDHFLREAEASGGAIGYQTLINEALRQHVEGKAPRLEETLRRIVREEMRAAS